MKRVLIVVLIALVPLTGCGKKRSAKSGAVAGKITYKGQPVNGALLHFYPDSDSEVKIPPISVAQDGTFSIASIPPGDYKVVVEPQSPPRGSGGGMPPMQGMDAAKQAEMKRKLAQVSGDMPTPTIPIPNKYKKRDSTDLKAAVGKGEQALNLELKD